MIVRWASAALLDKTKRFRRIRDYRYLHRLVSALETIEPRPNDALEQRIA
jgi:hypothetical protein